MLVTFRANERYGSQALEPGGLTCWQGGLNPLPNFQERDQSTLSVKPRLHMEATNHVADHGDAHQNQTASCLNMWKQIAH